MTMVEQVRNDSRTATIEHLTTSLDDGGLLLFETTEGTDPSLALAEVRAAITRFLTERGGGPEPAALVIAEALRVSAPYGVRAAACVDRRVLVAAHPDAGPAPVHDDDGDGESARAEWSPSATVHPVGITEFGKVPGPWLARLDDGHAIAIQKRIHPQVEIHPITEEQARAIGAYDRADRLADVTTSQLMNNPSGVMAAVHEARGLALLRRRNLVVGIVLAAEHPWLVGRHDDADVPSSL